MPPLHVRSRHLFAVAVLALALPHCALGFDVEVPDFDVSGLDGDTSADGGDLADGHADTEDVADAVSDATPDGTDVADTPQDAADVVNPDADVLQDAEDTLSDADADGSDGAPSDADVLQDTDDALADADVDGSDGTSDARVDAESDVRDDVDGDAESDADADVDVAPVPSVSVTSPAAGDYTTGTSIDVEWTTSGADVTVLDLVNAGVCRAGVEGVVVPEIASLDGATTSYEWDVPSATAPGAYRIRVTVTLGAESGFACSPEFTLQQPPGCEALGCAAQQRTCVLTGGTPSCGVCVEGFEDAAGACEIVDCGAAPAAPANSVLTSGGATEFGDVATYACDAGHTTTGQAGDIATITRRCGADGDWEASSADCLPVDCGSAPTAASNTTFESVDRTTLGGTATYSCNNGYVLQGAGGTGFSVTCETNGDWSEAATCEPVDCGPLANPANGTANMPAGTRFGAAATYSCSIGHTQTGGSSTRTCQPSGVWSGTIAVCTPVDCGAPPTVSNGNRTFSATTYTNIANYGCDGGYTRSGSATLTCGASGGWGTPPTCNDTDECATGAECTSFGNTCLNTPGSWQCGCVVGLTGVDVTAGDATCTLEPALLGEECYADSQCPTNSWCSTVTGQIRCSPRVFGGEAHQMDYVFVPAGTFEQGRAGAEIREIPYTATLSRNFFAARTEVTQGQWVAATGGVNPSCFQSIGGTGCTTGNVNPTGPVDSVDWYSALAYANWLSVNQGLNACYTLSPSTCADSISDWADGFVDCTDAVFAGLDCTGYRLPTESERERAARGGTTTVYYWGDQGDATTLATYAWYNVNAGGRSRPVAQKLPNAYGLYDMSGNVFEWAWDWVLNDEVGWIAYPEVPTTDYLGALSGTGKSIRGGSWFLDPSSMPTHSRFYSFPDDRFNALGFRLYRTAN